MRAASLPLPPSAGDAAPPAEIVLHCGGNASPLRIPVASGRTYRITARSASACSRLVHEAMRRPETLLVPRSGGLFENISVLENVVLPALYHRQVPVSEVAARVYAEFEACGLSHAQADSLCERSVPGLDRFERRLVAMVRALLMRPPVLLMERLFEGLTAADMGRAARFGGYYRRAVAGGTLILFDVTGMPGPDVTADVQAEAE